MKSKLNVSRKNKLRLEQLINKIENRKTEKISKIKSLLFFKVRLIELWSD